MDKHVKENDLYLTNLEKGNPTFIRNPTNTLLLQVYFPHFCLYSDSWLQPAIGPSRCLFRPSTSRPITDQCALLYNESVKCHCTTNLWWCSMFLFYSSHLHGKDVQQVSGVLNEIKVVLEDGDSASQSLVATATEQGHTHVEEDGGDEWGPGKAAHTALTALLTACRNMRVSSKKLSENNRLGVAMLEVEWGECSDVIYRRCFPVQPSDMWITSFNIWDFSIMCLEFFLLVQKC